jgi:hypothetical protein
VKRQTIIILIFPNGQPKPWEGLKKLCKHYGWSYNTLSKKKFPFEWKGFKIFKEQINK